MFLETYFRFIDKNVKKPIFRSAAILEKVYKGMKRFLLLKKTTQAYSSATLRNTLVSCNQELDIEVMLMLKVLSASNTFAKRTMKCLKFLIY